MGLVQVTVPPDGSKAEPDHRGVWISTPLKDLDGLYAAQVEQQIAEAI